MALAKTISINSRTLSPLVVLVVYYMVFEAKKENLCKNQMKTLQAKYAHKIFKVDDNIKSKEKQNSYMKIITQLLRGLFYIWREITATKIQTFQQIFQHFSGHVIVIEKNIVILGKNKGF